MLNSLLNASDAWVLQAYRKFQKHRDVKQLKDDLIAIAKDRSPAARAVAAAGVEDFFPRMIAFVEHLERVGMFTPDQAEVLFDRVDDGAAVVLAAYQRAEERPQSLMPLSGRSRLYQSAQTLNSSGAAQQASSGLQRHRHAAGPRKLGASVDTVEHELG